MVTASHIANDFIDIKVMSVNFQQLFNLFVSFQKSLNPKNTGISWTEKVGLICTMEVFHSTRNKQNNLLNYFPSIWVHHKYFSHAFLQYFFYIKIFIHTFYVYQQPAKKKKMKGVLLNDVWLSEFLILHQMNKGKKICGRTCS